MDPASIPKRIFDPIIAIFSRIPVENFWNFTQNFQELIYSQWNTDLMLANSQLLSSF